MRRNGSPLCWPMGTTIDQGGGTPIGLSDTWPRSPCRAPSVPSGVHQRLYRAARWHQCHDADIWTGSLSVPAETMKAVSWDVFNN
jgi:hypothetical protein